jgi:hypothetical protein
LLALVFALGILLGNHSIARADHFTEEESSEYKQNLDSELKDGTLNKENYEAKMEYLKERHADSKVSADLSRKGKDSGWVFVGVILPGIVLGGLIMFGIRKGLFAALRDTSRDTLSGHLNKILGIKAVMADRGRPEEKIRASLFGMGSMGIIDLPDESLVSWINVVRIKRRDKNGPARYRTVFGIPDDTIPLQHKQIKIKTIRKKNFPIFGKIVDVYWRGNDSSLGLVEKFSEDQQIDDLAKGLGNLSIFTHPGKMHGWTFETDRIGLPTMDQWEVIQKIAEFLLKSPR